MISGFERGANVSMSVPFNLFAVGLALIVLVAVVIVYLGAIRGWMRSDIKVDELKGYIIRGLVFIAVVTVFLGLV